MSPCNFLSIHFNFKYSFHGELKKTLPILVFILGSISLVIRGEEPKTFDSGNTTFTIEAHRDFFIITPVGDSIKYRCTSTCEHFVPFDSMRAHKKIKGIINKIFRESDFDCYPFVFLIRFGYTNKGEMRNISFRISDEYKDCIDMDILSKVYDALITLTVEGRGNYGDDTLEYMTWPIRFRSKP